MTASVNPTREQMRVAVERYLSAVADGTAEQIADLYAPDATVEDPAGSVPLRGRDAIVDFYRPLSDVTRRTRLREFRAAGDTAAFAFEVEVLVPDGRITTAPIDVMTFDIEGRITSMRAIWSNEDMRMESTEPIEVSQ